MTNNNQVSQRQWIERMLTLNLMSFPGGQIVIRWDAQRVGIAADSKGHGISLMNRVLALGNHPPIKISGSPFLAPADFARDRKNWHFVVLQEIQNFPPILRITDLLLKQYSEIQLSSEDHGNEVSLWINGEYTRFPKRFTGSFRRERTIASPDIQLDVMHNKDLLDRDGYFRKEVRMVDTGWDGLLPDFRSQPKDKCWGHFYGSSSDWFTALRAK